MPIFSFIFYLFFWHCYALLPLKDCLKEKKNRKATPAIQASKSMSERQVREAIISKRAGFVPIHPSPRGAYRSKPAAKARGIGKRPTLSGHDRPD